MSVPQETDLRLRHFLNTNQAARERMCIALLQLDQRFTNVRPRRPEGGPDGGRDIECSINGGQCYGAVGFKNSADDSDSQRAEVEKKFKADLDSAIKVNQNIIGFVFFTNVDLTPSQIQELSSHARSRSIGFVEIFHRERMRIELDAVRGFHVRLQYLDLSLSDAEQKAFFNQFGDDLHRSISGKLLSIEERLEELEFRRWMRGRCRSISIDVCLTERYEVSLKANPYRFALRAHQAVSDGKGSFWAGCWGELKKIQNIPDIEKISYVYFDTDLMPQQKCSTKIFRSGTRIIGQGFDSIGFGFSAVQDSPFSTESGFDMQRLATYHLDFFADADWSSLIDHVKVWYDDYMVYRFSAANKIPSALSRNSIPHWPTAADSLKDRPVELWTGFGPHFDYVPTRSRYKFHTVNEQVF